MWPRDPESLQAQQRELSRATPEPWDPSGANRVGGCWACFPQGLTGPGNTDDPAWGAAVTLVGRRVVDEQVVCGYSGGPYVPGLLGMREGALLERAVRALAVAPDVVLVNATGRDHPRRAGLAIHLGQVLDLPTVGVTHRPLTADGPWPPDRSGAVAPLWDGADMVAAWVRTRPGTRPVVVHSGWRVALTSAVDLVNALPGRHRTPDPLRRARERARQARFGRSTR